MTFDEFADECLERSAGDVRAAAELGRKRLNEEEVLADELLEEILHFALHEKMRECMRSQRPQYASRVGGVEKTANPDQGVEGLRAHAQHTAAEYGWDIYNYPLAGGIQLGSATREHVERQAEIHRVMVQSNSAKLRWFEAILERVPKTSKKPISKHLTREEIQALKEQAEQA